MPVVLGFGLYRGGNRYELVFESFADGIEVPRGQRAAALSALIRRYASRLETCARSAPYNWFNFYDFWQPHPDDARAQPHAAPVLDDAAVQRRTAVGRRAAGG